MTHYNWRLKDIKSVLVITASLKGTERDRPEGQVLIKTLAFLPLEILKHKDVSYNTTSCKVQTLQNSHTLQNSTTNHKAILKDTTRNHSFKTTKLKYKLKLQCRHTITLEYYNTTVLKFTPKKENNQISINILKLIYLKYQTYILH